MNKIVFGQFTATTHHDTWCEGGFFAYTVRDLNGAAVEGAGGFATLEEAAKAASLALEELEGMRARGAEF